MLALADTASTKAALIAIRRHLEDARVLAAMAEDIAVEQCRDDEALAEFRSATESIWAAIVNEAEPVLAAARDAERRLTGRDEITDAEHVAQERAMHRWRSVA